VREIHDLPAMAAELLAAPPFRTPPVPEVAARARLLRLRRRLAVVGGSVTGMAVGQEFLVQMVKSLWL
jgi:hypothetical protein